MGVKKWPLDSYGNFSEPGRERFTTPLLTKYEEIRRKRPLTDSELLTVIEHQTDALRTEEETRMRENIKTVLEEEN